MLTSRGEREGHMAKLERLVSKVPLAKLLLQLSNTCYLLWVCFSNGLGSQTQTLTQIPQSFVWTRPVEAALWHSLSILCCCEFPAHAAILDKARRKYKLQRLSNVLKLNEPLPQYVHSTQHLLHSGFTLQFTNQLLKLKHLSPKAFTDWLVNKNFYKENFTSIMEEFHLIWDDEITCWSTSFLK